MSDTVSSSQKTKFCLKTKNCIPCLTKQTLFLLEIILI